MNLLYNLKISRIFGYLNLHLTMTDGLFEHLFLELKKEQFQINHRIRGGNR